MRVAVLHLYRKHLPDEVYDMYYFIWMDPESGKRGTYIRMPLPITAPRLSPTDPTPQWTRAKAARALDVLHSEWGLKRSNIRLDVIDTQYLVEVTSRRTLESLLELDMVNPNSDDYSEGENHGGV